MFDLEQYEDRFHEILDALDACRDQVQGVSGEEMEELNANFEDALFVIDMIALPGDEDWREAFGDALKEFEDLSRAYKAMENRPSDLGRILESLEKTILQAREDLQNS